MSTTVCLCANALYYPEGGGHLWVYLNWALGLRALGCNVIWLEEPELYSDAAIEEVHAYVLALKSRLERYGFAKSVALVPRPGEALPRAVAEECLGLDAVVEADLLLNLQYGAAPELVRCFRRSALVDIDPGLLQIWMSAGDLIVAAHDVYFTIGETVGQPGSRIPDVGLEWQHTPPCVALDWWPPHRAAEGAPWTTVSHWSGDAWIEEGEEGYENNKRDGFLPFLELPRHTTQALELALCLSSEEEEYERRVLGEHGWGVQHAHTVAATPWDYQRYVQVSCGEFSCVKPSCIHLQNAWISDRTLCYLASGKPAVVQHTGPSRFLPDAAGLLRFRDLDEAARCLEMAAADYDRHCHLARTLAEEYFDARKVAGRVLERALA